MSYRKKHIKTKIRRLRSKKSILKNRWFWFSVLFLIIIFSVVYALAFFGRIQVKNIIIYGNQEIESKEIESIVFKNVDKKIFSFGGQTLATKSIFLVNTAEINREILNRFPEIESLKVEKKMPQTLIVAVIERKPFAVFCKPNQGLPPEDCFFIDESGVIFEALQNIPNDIAVVRQTDIKDVFVRENVVAKNIMDIISKSEKILKDNFQIDIKEALVTSPVRLNLTTTENWQIYFNLDSDTDLQITKMNLVLRNEIPESARKNLQYIDLRFKDRAYYK